MKNIKNILKNVRKMDEKAQSTYLLLGITFIMSQNITWRLLPLIPGIEKAIIIKSSSLYQTCASAIFVFAAIFLTSDGDIFSRFLQNHPAIMFCINKVIYIEIIVFWTLFFSIIFFFGLLWFSPEKFKSEFYSTKKEILDYAKCSISSPFLNVKIIQGIFYFVVLLVILSFFLPASIISVVADIFSMALGIVSFSLVICNVRTKMINDRLIEMNKEKEGGLS